VSCGKTKAGHAGRPCVCVNVEYRKAFESHIKRDDWYLWAHMFKGAITMPVFQSLDAYWPGLLVSTSPLVALHSNTVSSVTAKLHTTLCLKTAYYTVSQNCILHCVSKNAPTLKRYSSKLYGSILMTFGRNIQKSLE